MTRPAPLFAAALLGLCACASPPPPAPPTTDAPEPPPMQAACNADAARAAIGKQATAEVVEQARKEAGAGMARVLRPGQMVTMEYRGDRLNVDVDAKDVVTGVRCG